VDSHFSVISKEKREVDSYFTDISKEKGEADSYFSVISKEKREADSHFSVISKEEKKYHIECQVRNDNKIAIRIFEYDSQLALKDSEIEEAQMVVRFPNTAILYLDSTDSTPDTIKIRIQTNSGEITHEVPTIKVKKYSLEELFEKNLLFLLPFYIFNYSKYRVGQMEEAKTAKQKEELEQLLSDFKYLVQRIEE
jgi:hypothetical protein